MDGDKHSRRSFLKRSAVAFMTISGFTIDDVVRGEQFTVSQAANNIPVIELKQSAIRKFHEVAEFMMDESLSEVILRFELTGNETDGYEVWISFEQRDQEDPERDVAHEFDGIRVVVARDCASVLTGTAVRLVQKEDICGFQFTGPFFDQHQVKPGER